MFVLIPANSCQYFYRLFAKENNGGWGNLSALPSKITAVLRWLRNKWRIPAGCYGRN